MMKTFGLVFPQPVDDDDDGSCDVELLGGCEYKRFQLRNDVACLAQGSAGVNILPQSASVMRIEVGEIASDGGENDVWKLVPRRSVGRVRKDGRS